MKRIYIFIGPEGAGKSTQSQMLATELGLPRVATGDVLRHIQEKDKGDLGKKVKKMFMDNGYLVADLILRIMGEQLRESVYSQGVVLDGSLRTYDEVMHFDAMLQRLNLQLPVVVLYLTIPKNESIKRLTYGRKRLDDIIGSVTTRLSHFHERLDERLAIIEKKYQLISIDGMKSKDTVHEEIMEKISRISK